MAPDNCSSCTDQFGFSTGRVLPVHASAGPCCTAERFPIPCTPGLQTCTSESQSSTVGRLRERKNCRKKSNYGARKRACGKKGICSDSTNWSKSEKKVYIYQKQMAGRGLVTVGRNQSGIRMVRLYSDRYYSGPQLFATLGLSSSDTPYEIRAGENSGRRFRGESENMGKERRL